MITGTAANNLSAIPKQSAALFLTLLLVCLALFIFALYPGLRSSRDLDRRILSIETSIGQQELLGPLHGSLATGSRPHPGVRMQSTFKKRLNRRDIIRLLHIFGPVAEKSGLALTRCTPDIDTLRSGAPRLLVNLSAVGPWSGFRAFLIGASQIPFVERMGRIRVETTAEGKTYSMNLWLLLESPR